MEIVYRDRIVAGLPVIRVTAEDSPFTLRSMLQKEARRRSLPPQEGGQRRNGGDGPDCQIVLDLPEGSRREMEAMADLTVDALFAGAYRFRKDCLKNWDAVAIFRNRDGWADYGDARSAIVGPAYLRSAVEEGAVAARCVGYARSLGNLPYNYLKIPDFVRYARELAIDCGLRFQALAEDSLRKMGCGGILAVNQAGEDPAVLLTLSGQGLPEGIAGQEEGLRERPSAQEGKNFPGHFGAQKEEKFSECPRARGPLRRPLRTALVGKGLLFDSGGYHLKSIDGMKGMHFDMCGAANLLECMETAARLGFAQNLVVVLPLAENLIGPKAVKMGDVVQTMSGKTVEVYNTDAEGRLVLCDALTYAQRLGCRRIVDLATLTYSCQNALGDETVGVFSNQDTLYGEFAKQMERTGQRCWRLPLGDVYRQALCWSKTADIANYAPGKGAGASVAASFLEYFIEPGTQWLHLDVAGPAVLRNDSPQQESGATGVCMAAIRRLLREDQ